MADGVSNILQQIANPKVANLPADFIAGRQAAQKTNLLKEQLIGAKRANTDAEVQSKRSETAKGILAAFSAGPGDNRNAILSDVLRRSGDDVPTQESVQGLLQMPDGPEKEQKFNAAISYFQQAGYLPKPARAGKTQEQIDIENALKQRGLDLEQKRADLREQELGKDRTPKSKLKRAIDERNALPEDSPYIEGYDKYIKNLTDGKQTFSEEVVNENIQAVLSGAKDPDRLSKRGGLQAIVEAGVRKLDPNFNFVEASANAKYKQAQGNLLSRALIGGVQPLYDELRAKGESLKNTKIKMFNAVTNWFKEQTGDADVVAFNNLRDDVIAETERILLGSGVLSDTKYVRAVNNLKTSNSPKQIQIAIDQFEFVVDKRLQALKDEPYEKNTIAFKNRKSNKPAADAGVQDNDPLGIR